MDALRAAVQVFPREAREGWSVALDNAHILSGSHIYRLGCTYIVWVALQVSISALFVLQVALQERTSRMRIELPPGFDFGVEGDREKKGALTAKRVQRSDRELARLFVEMFHGTGLIVFRV